MRTRSRLALLTLASLLGLAPQPAAAQSARLFVDEAREEKYFVINGVPFGARQFCRRVKAGDEVTFLTGSSDGRCTGATFLDLNSGEKCEVWCTEPSRQLP